MLSLQTNVASFVASKLLTVCRGTTRFSHDIREIEQRLLGFGGGSVTLAKRTDGLGIITIDNPSKKNAFTGTMCVALREAVSELKTWQDGKCVIVRGIGGTFCAGADLSMVKQISSHEDGERFSYFMQSTLTELLQLPLVSVALIDGNALGGGAELATACDFRILTGHSGIGFVHARMGLVPGWGGGTRLVRLVGRAVALHLLLTARPVRADEAKRMGLADHVLGDPEVQTAASGRAGSGGDGTFTRDEALCELTAKWILGLTGSHPASVVRSIKTMAATASISPFEESTLAERQLFKKLWGGEANIRALAKNLKHDG